MQMVMGEDGVVNDKGEPVQAPYGQLSTYLLRGPRIGKGKDDEKRERIKGTNILNLLYACSFQIQLLSTRWSLSGWQRQEWLGMGFLKTKQKGKKRVTSRGTNSGTVQTQDPLFENEVLEGQEGH
jgi:hypothetical protein